MCIDLTDFLEYTKQEAKKIKGILGKNNYRWKFLTLAISTILDEKYQ